MRSFESLSLSFALTFFLQTLPTHAFVPFAYSLHPAIDMSALSVATLNPIDMETSLPPSPASTPLPDTEPTSSPSSESEHAELKPRQAQVTAPAAALPEDMLQISPVTTYEIQSYPAGGGAPVRIPVAYTQTFADVPDQWPAAGVGSIGLGDIQGEVGVVKSKRFVPFAVEVMTASSFTA